MSLYLEEARSKKEPLYTKREYEVVKKNLKRGKACGRDSLPPEIFINGGDHLQTLLHSLFNLLKKAIPMDPRLDCYNLQEQGKRKTIGQPPWDRFKAGLIKDQTFLVRAAVDHCKYVNKPLYLVLYGYSDWTHCV